ncbi:MAG: sensor histidine kinase, partial [Cohnella sp.]|nr:sensor histidine kinase [Cohnella sp.]
PTCQFRCSPLPGNPILKLTLQPLVENSIQHGFEGIDYMGRIQVRARVEGRNIAIYVEDNGIGMSNERMALLTENATASFDDRHEESPETGERRGLGFGNVADRLRIHYGNGYGLILCSAAGQGTTIKCIIPKAVGGNEDDETKGVVGR